MQINFFVHPGQSLRNKLEATRPTSEKIRSYVSLLTPNSDAACAAMLQSDFDVLDKKRETIHSKIDPSIVLLDKTLALWNDTELAMKNFFEHLKDAKQSLGKEIPTPHRELKTELSAMEVARSFLFILPS